MKLVCGMPVHNNWQKHGITFEEIFTLLQDAVAALPPHFETSILVIGDNAEPTLLKYCNIGNITDQKPPNLGYAVNRLLRAVPPDTDFYLHIESDVSINTQDILKMVKKLQDNPEIGIVAPEIYTIAGIKDTSFYCESYYPAADTPVDWVPFSCMMMRGSDVLNPRVRADSAFKLYCADTDFCHRFRKITGKTIIMDKDIRALHVGHASTDTVKGNPDPECFVRLHSRWNNRMAVLVGVPVHNSIESTLRCLRAVKESCDYANVEYHILIINDGSNAETLKRLEETGLEIVHTTGEAPNLGQAVNIGLERARNPIYSYYWNVESDVYPLAECLHDLLEAHKNYPNAGILCPLFLHDNNNDTVAHAFPGQAGIDLCGKNYIEAPQTVIKVPWQHLGCNLIPRKVYQNPTIRVDESFRLWCCDFDLSWCIEDAGFDLLYVGKARAKHTGSLSSSTVNRESFEDERLANKRVREKWNRIHL